MVYYENSHTVSPQNPSLAGNLAKLKRQLHKTCACCYLPSLGDGYICRYCQNELWRNTWSCPRCAVPMVNSDSIQSIAIQSALCGDCQQQPPHFDQAISPFIYTNSIKPLIEQVKANQVGAIKFAAQCLFESIKHISQTGTNVFMPIPMSSQKLKYRHCNPSQLLAHEVLKLIKKEDSLRRCQQQHFIQNKDYPPQKGLDLKQRQKNVKNAFELAPKAKDVIKGETMFIIDDVMTTGCTLNEASRITRLCKPKEIIVVSLARTPKAN